MHIALYQLEEPASLQAGLETVDTALRQAGASGVDMLVLPEAFLPGYTQTSGVPPHGWAQIENRLAQLCTQHGVALTIGLPDYAAGRVYNTALCIGADGATLARFRKLQLFGPDEKALYTAGNGYVTFDYQGTRFGLLLCYDIEFPEHARALARLGAQVILVPTANMMPFTNVNLLMVPSRAAENGITIVYANYCGAGRGLSYAGLSTIVGPDGFALACKGHSAGLCVAALPHAGWSEHDIPRSTQIADYTAI